MQRFRKLNPWLAATALGLATALLSACGSDADTDWEADASRAGLSAMTAPDGNGAYAVTLQWLDTLDGELGWRVEALRGDSWQPLSSVSAVSGYGQKLSVRQTITADTVLRVVALVPGDRVVALGTASLQTQLTARTQLPGVAVTFTGPDQPLSGDTTLGLSGAAKVLSAQYAAYPLTTGVVGDGLLGVPVSRTAPTFSVPWRSSLLADGLYLLDAKVEVEPGNFTVLRRTLDAHNSGLKLAVATEVSGQQVNLRLQLESNVVKPVVKVWVDSVLKVTQTLDTGWQVSNWPVALGALAAGSHDIVVQASDSTGAIAQVSTRVAVASAVPPEVLAAAAKGALQVTLTGSGCGFAGVVSVLYNDVDGSNTYRLERLVGSTWVEDRRFTGTGNGQRYGLLVAPFPSSAGVTFRLLLVLPSGATTPLLTPSLRGEVTAPTDLPGVTLQASGGLPIKGDTTLSLANAPTVRSVVWSARQDFAGPTVDVGLPLTPVTTGPRYEQPWRTSKLPDGAYVVTAALETAADSSVYLCRTVDVRNTGP